VDDFQTITFCNLDLIPTSSRDDLPVEFYGDSVSFETQGQDDAGQD
jgi:hypothetical protein